MELKGLRKFEKSAQRKQAHEVGCSCPSCTKKEDAIKKILENKPKPTEPNQGRQTGCPPGCSCPSCAKKTDSIDKILNQVGKSKNREEKQLSSVEATKHELARQELVLKITNQMNQGKTGYQPTPLAQTTSSQNIENNGSSIHLRRTREGVQKEYIKAVVRGERKGEIVDEKQETARRYEEKSKEPVARRTNHSQEIEISLPVATKKEEIVPVAANIKEAEEKQEGIPNRRKNKREKVRIKNEEMREKTVQMRIEELSAREISMIINTQLQLEIAKKHQKTPKTKIKQQETEEVQKDKKKSKPKKIENNREKVATREEREKAEKIKQTKIRGVEKKEEVKNKKAVQKEREPRSKEIKILEKQASEIVKNLEKSAVKNKETGRTISQKQKIDKIISNKIQELIKIRKQLRNAKKLKNQKAIKKYIKQIKKIIQEIKRKRIVLALLTASKKSKLKKIITKILGILKNLLNRS